MSSLMRGTQVAPLALRKAKEGIRKLGNPPPRQKARPVFPLLLPPVTQERGGRVDLDSWLCFSHYPWRVHTASSRSKGVIAPLTFYQPDLPTRFEVISFMGGIWAPGRNKEAKTNHKVAHISAVLRVYPPCGLYPAKNG